VDADGYGRTGEVLAQYFVDPASRDSAREWFRQYAHSTTALAPLLMSLPIALGAPMDLVYLELSALSGFASLLIFAHILLVRMGFSYRTTLVFSLGFASHLLMLRSFARPVTDMFGLLLVIATVDLLLKRIERWRPVDDFALAALALCHPLARPQGWSYWICMALAVLACDFWRRGRAPGTGEAVSALARVFALPLGVLAVLHGFFGWLHNLQIMLDKAAHFRADNTLWFFYHSLVGTCQLLPLFWLRAGHRLLEPRLLLCLGWPLLYFAILAVVRAPFWMRHFLPILPAVLVLAAAGFERCRGRWRGAALGLLALTAAFNVLATVYQILYSTKAGVHFSRYISTP
jgi:hypothetical protein